MSPNQFAPGPLPTRFELITFLEQYPDADKDIQDAIVSLNLCECETYNAFLGELFNWNEVNPQPMVFVTIGYQTSEWQRAKRLSFSEVQRRVLSRPQNDE